MPSAEIASKPGTALSRAMILVTLTFVVMLYAMTVTVANVALPQMQGAMAATTDQIAWVVTFNIVATAVVTPTAGWLAARFGRRRLMLFCVAGFICASILCGMASGLAELVFYRILQGGFGAPLVPVAQAIALDTYPRRQHNTVMAIWGMGVILGPIIAPTIGGYLSETYSWRWVFFMVVPFGLIAFAGVWTFIAARGIQRKPVRLDWTGLLALVVAIAALQLMLDRGERNDWFESAEIMLEAAIAVVAFYVFLAHSATADRPFLSPSLFLDRNLVVGLLLALIFGMLNFTPMVLLPPLLQGLRGFPDSIIGYLLAFRGVGTLAGFTFMLFAARLDPRVPMAIGFACQAVAGYAMAQFDINLTIVGVAWTSALQGLGVGLIWVPLAVVTFSTLAPRHTGDGTAVFHLLRNIGASIYISISIAVVLRTSKINYAEMAEFISPFNEVFSMPWARGIWSMESRGGLAQLSGEIQRQSMMIGYINAFYFFATTAVVVLPLILLIRKGERPAAEPGG